MSEQINVIAAMTLAARLLDAHHPGHKSPAAAKLDEAREAVADLIQAARDCNEWLCRTDREHTAHQRQLAEALNRIMD